MVMDVNRAEVLASASYPTYSLSTFSQTIRTVGRSPETSAKPGPPRACIPPAPPFQDELLPIAGPGA